MKLVNSIPFSTKNSLQQYYDFKQWKASNLLRSIHNDEFTSDKYGNKRFFTLKSHTSQIPAKWFVNNTTQNSAKSSLLRFRDKSQKVGSTAVDERTKLLSQLRIAHREPTPERDLNVIIHESTGHRHNVSLDAKSKQRALERLKKLPKLTIDDSSPTAQPLPSKRWKAQPFKHRSKPWQEKRENMFSVNQYTTERNRLYDLRSYDLDRIWNVNMSYSPK